MQELLNLLNNAKNSLDDYYSIHKDYANIRNSPKDYLEWVDKKLESLLIYHNSFKKQKNIYCVEMLYG